MAYFCEDPPAGIRKMRDCAGDYRLMLGWLSDPAVSKYYPGPDGVLSLEKIMEKYRPRVAGEDPVTACIVEISGAPAGYIQYYPIQDEEAYDLRGEITVDFTKKHYGIDLFIAGEGNRNKGFGTKIIRLLLGVLFERENADTVFIDPQTWNGRAVRCYEKCGFKPVKVIEKRESHNGEWKDNLIMSVQRHEYTARECANSKKDR